MRELRRLAGLLVVACCLGACGVFGDDDADASSASSTTIVPAEVRVTLGDRWVEVDPTTIALSSSGEPTAATLQSLESLIASIDAEATEPMAGSIEWEPGTGFVVRPGTPGRQPDLGSLARSIVASPGSDVAMPFQTIDVAPSDERLAGITAILNERISDGMTMAVGGERRTLTAAELGPAVSIEVGPENWQADVEWSAIAEPLRTLFDDLQTEPTPASFEVSPPEDEDGDAVITIVPGGSAMFCCDESSTRRIVQAIENEFELAPLILGDDRGAASIAEAEELGIVELVGSFTTSYTPGQNRVTNIRRIAELTQGVILAPGETFSLNDHVGRRTRENGFVAAGTIVNGHLVDSVGGGISQFATTIFNAAFFAGLEFEEYQAHSIYFSRYPYGREATISWPRPHLKIHNPTPYGILIWPTSTSNSVTVDLYSTKWVDVEQTGQWSNAVQAACTRVTTERTRTWIDEERVEVDTVFATYRPEGIACDGSETQNPDEEQIEKLENGEDPDFENGDAPVDPDADPDPNADPDADPPAEDPPAEDPPTDDPPPADDPGTGDPPTEDPPADDPADDPPADDPPAEDPPAQDPPPEDPPADPEPDPAA